MLLGARGIVICRSAMQARGTRYHAYRTVPLPAQLRVTLENSPSRVRAPKISTTTPCKVAGGRRHSTKQLDTSGKSGAFFDYSEIRSEERRVGKECRTRERAQR